MRNTPAVLLAATILFSIGSPQLGGAQSPRATVPARSHTYEPKMYIGFSADSGLPGLFVFNGCGALDQKTWRATVVVYNDYVAPAHLEFGVGPGTSKIVWGARQTIKPGENEPIYLDQSVYTCDQITEWSFRNIRFGTDTGPFLLFGSPMSPVDF